MAEDKETLASYAHLFEQQMTPEEIAHDLAEVRREVIRTNARLIGFEHLFTGDEMSDAELLARTLGELHKAMRLLTQDLGSLRLRVEEVHARLDDLEAKLTPPEPQA